jgi:hypothetical protein
MNLDSFLKSGVEYGGDLIRSALEGARGAEEEILEGESLPSLLLRSARASLAPGATAVSLGVLTGYWMGRRRSVPSAVAFGLAGAVIGFAGGMAWSTRHMTGGMARGAIRKIIATRDAHWLANHPVDYA